MAGDAESKFVRRSMIILRADAIERFKQSGDPEEGLLAATYAYSAIRLLGDIILGSINKGKQP